MARPRTRTRPSARDGRSQHPLQAFCHRRAPAASRSPCRVRQALRKRRAGARLAAGARRAKARGDDARAGGPHKRGAMPAVLAAVYGSGTSCRLQRDRRQRQGAQPRHPGRHLRPCLYILTRSRVPHTRGVTDFAQEPSPYPSLEAPVAPVAQHAGRGRAWAEGGALSARLAVAPVLRAACRARAGAGGGRRRARGSPWWPSRSACCAVRAATTQHAPLPFLLSCRRRPCSAATTTMSA